MGDIIFDFFSRAEFQNPLTAMWFLFIHGGWFVIGVAVIRGLWLLWIHEIRAHYASKIEYILLGIKVPKQTEQSPKAVENIFGHLVGLHEGFGNLIEKYWHGKNQQNFAVELVSRGGNIQYFIYIQKKHRSVAEASIFAQYPDAEISEAVDYTNEFPSVFPDEKYEMYGAELALSKSSVYPIRTHVAFFDQVSGLFKDPLASLLEFMSTLHPGEEMWIQIPLAPADDDWKEKSMEEVKKIIKAPSAHHKPGIITSIIQHGFEIFFGALYLIAGGKPQEGGVHKESKPDMPSIMQHLSPGERAVVEQIQMKATKPAFHAKVRALYIAPKEIFKKPKFMAGIVGAFKQVSSLDLNAFKVDKYTKTAANYLFKEQRVARRKTKLMRAYKGRSNRRGGKNYLFNTEELATLWHFPMIDVKAPLIVKALSKTAEPPIDLPIERVYRPSSQEPAREPDKDEAPDNLPFI